MGVCFVTKSEIFASKLSKWVEVEYKSSAKINVFNPILSLKNIWR